jgi:hypothetical protein
LLGGSEGRGGWVESNQQENINRVQGGEGCGDKSKKIM